MQTTPFPPPHPVKTCHTPSPSFSIPAPLLPHPLSPAATHWTSCSRQLYHLSVKGYGAMWQVNVCSSATWSHLVNCTITFGAIICQPTIIVAIATDFQPHPASHGKLGKQTIYHYPNHKMMWVTIIVFYPLRKYLCSTACAGHFVPSLPSHN